MLTGAVQKGVFTVSGELCLSHLEDFKLELENALGMAGPMTVDVSKVQEVDFAGLQLLLAFINSRRPLAPTTLTGLTPMFEKALVISGLNEHFTSLET